MLRRGQLIRQKIAFIGWFSDAGGELLPSSPPSHHYLRGHRILLCDGAGVVPEHSAPPLVRPSIFREVDDLVHLILALWLCLLLA